MPGIKTIAIIQATSEMGSVIARSLSKSPKYRLLLMSDDEKRLDELLAEIGAHKSEDEMFAMTCAREASWEADIIIMATECSDERNVADKIRDVAIGKIVISTSNPRMDAYNNPDKMGNEIAEEFQKLLPHSKAVKAFNEMIPNDFTSRGANEKRVNVFVVGNSGDAIETASEILTHAGFNPIICGRSGSSEN